MRALTSTLRRLLQRRAATAAITSTLALAIGANVIIFSAVDAVLLRRLPYPGGERLVSVYESSQKLRQATSLVAPVRLEEWNRLDRSFDGIAGCYFENMTDTTGAVPERIAAMRISARFFAVLGVAAQLGRTPDGDEERFGGSAVVVISDRLWRSRFNADPAIVGRTLRLGGATRLVIGVMPASFAYPDAETDVWAPAQLPPALQNDAREARFLRAVGRLKPGVTLAQAQQDLAAIQASLGRLHPQTDADWTAAVVGLADEQTSGVRRSLWLLFAAGGLMFLAACGNLACVEVASAAVGARELAIRLAIGATRAMVIRERFTEALVLAVTGALGGLLIARWGIDALRTGALPLPGASDGAVNLRSLVFLVIAAVVAALLFGLAPALYSTRRNVADALTRGGRGHTGGSQSAQRVLVASQVTLAMTLLCGASLFVRTFERLHTSPLGFDPAHVLTFRISAQWSERPAALMNRQLRTVDRLQRVPGVAAVAFSSVLPAGADLPPGEFRIVGRDTGESLFAYGRQVSAGYFRTVGIPMLTGDTCRDDPADTPFTKVVVTRAFADRFFPGEDPIGHGIVRSMPAGVEARIIGVAADVRENGAAKDPPPLIYTCGLSPYWPDPYYLVRTEPSRPAALSELRRALREVDPERALYDAAPLEQRLSHALAGPRLNAVLVAAFAVMSVLLAAIGLYGVLAQFVAARRRDIGVRLALGATPYHIVGQIVAHAAMPTLAGIAVGIIAAAASARLASKLLFGVSARDPVTFTLVPLVIAAVAAAAAVVPARRAVHVDPAESLRET